MECRSIHCKKKHGDWYIYPVFLAGENLNNAPKNVVKSYNIIKPRIHNVVSTWTNIANNMAFLVLYGLC